MRRDFFSLSVRCKHVCLLVCCWFYCISQNVSTSYTILTFPLRLHECSFPILSYLFLLSLLRLLLLLLHSVLLFFYTSLLWACAIISFHIIPLKRSTSDIHDAEYGALWIPLDVFFFHFFFLLFANTIPRLLLLLMPFLFPFAIFFIIRFVFVTHIFLIYLCISVVATAFLQAFFPGTVWGCEYSFTTMCDGSEKQKRSRTLHTHTHTRTHAQTRFDSNTQAEWYTVLDYFFPFSFYFILSFIHPFSVLFAWESLLLLLVSTSGSRILVSSSINFEFLSTHTHEELKLNNV